MKRYSPIRLYFKYMSMHLRSQMQYKGSFLFGLFGHFLGSFTAFLGITFMFARFNSIEGYTYSQVLICFAAVITSFSLAECCVRGLDRFTTVISNGEFDRILVRPRSPMFQVAVSQASFERLGRLLQATAVLIYAIPTSGVDWTAVRIACLVLMILCGTAVFSGTFTLYATVCFYTTEGLEFMNIVTDGVREYGKYPLAIYGKGVLKFTTYVIPYALIQYYPFLYIIGKETSPIYALIPLASLLYLIPCTILWRIGVRHYRSTGS